MAHVLNILYRNTSLLSTTLSTRPTWHKVKNVGNRKTRIRKNNMIAIRDLEMTKERLLSFAEYAKDAQPEVLVTLIQTIVERIYIVDKDDERYCHIFIKGCSGEDYTGFFQTAGYIEQKTTPVCDSEQYCIVNT